MMLRTLTTAAALVLCMASCRGQRLPTRSAPIHMSTQLFDTIISRGSPAFKSWMLAAKERNIQILITSPLTSRNGPPVLIHSGYGVNDSVYFYPASTVKLPLVLLAYEKINRLAARGITDSTALIFESIGNAQVPFYNQPDAPRGIPNIRTDAAQILLVSDNEAYNRLYDFVGTAEVRKSLKAKGLNQTIIRHRLSISQPDKVQRTKPALRFVDSLGRTLHSEPEQYDDAKHPEEKVLLGKGYMKGGKKVMQPFEFTYRNRVSLKDLHGILLRLAYPESFKPGERFDITPTQRAQILQWMEMPPAQGPIARYKSPEYWDTYCKFLYYGSEKVPFDPNVQIRNKVGDAYGFLTDLAWITNRKTGKSFVLSATISCNDDGIFNDNVYEYDRIGFPFMKELARIVYQLSNEGQIP